MFEDVADCLGTWQRGIEMIEGCQDAIARFIGTSVLADHLSNSTNVTDSES